MPSLSTANLAHEVAARTWYHRIDLGHGIVTPGHGWDDLWNNIRGARAHIGYAGKRVLDIGSWDGMWAFEAERLGAATVVATDCMRAPLDNLLFCRDTLGSRVVPYYNVSPYNLRERLDCFFEGSRRNPPTLFDIAQLTGVLYHVRDPLLVLSQARSVLADGGMLLFETAAVADDEASYMLFNNVPPKRAAPGSCIRTYYDQPLAPDTPEQHWARVYGDVTTWWAPTTLCLREMLAATLFAPVEESIRILPQGTMREPRGTRDYERVRIALAARAVSPDEANEDFADELSRTYRNPGLAPVPFSDT